MYKKLYKEIKINTVICYVLEMHSGFFEAFK